MHPFPKQEELQFSVGRELETVCLGQWLISFGFDGASINVEGALEHVDQSSRVHRHNTDDDRPSPVYLHHLLGQSVQGFSVEPFCLTLTFSSGDLLRIFSDEGAYECGQIYREHDSPIVF